MGGPIDPATGRMSVFWEQDDEFSRMQADFAATFLHFRQQSILILIISLRYMPQKRCWLNIDRFSKMVL